MNIFLHQIILYAILFCKIRDTFEEFNKSPSKEFSIDDKNTQCCQKNLGCCKKSTDPTNFEIRALMQKCMPENCGCKEVPKPEKKCDDDDDSENDTELKNCLKKLLLTVKIKNFGITNCKSQYIIVDHIFDASTNRKQVLLNPYVVRIRQHGVMQKYDLQYDTVVNSKAKEKVLNKNDPGYTGCNTTPNNPTCGAVKYKDKVVPYSTGFCCSCKSEASRQSGYDSGGDMLLDSQDSAMADIPVSEAEELASAIPEHAQESAVSEPGQARVDVAQEETGDRFKEAADNAADSPTKPPNDVQVIDIVGKREAKISHKQKRGGQDCNDNFTPPDVDPVSYHSSTHCLEFSDVWYSAYKFGRPHIDHSLQLEVYEKFEDQEGKFHWVDLTVGPINIGNATGQYSNEDNTIIAIYKSHDVAEDLFSIKYQTQKLLIPESKKDIDTTQYPEIQGGPPEYLVVNSSQIRSSGKECNKAGVGYEAFVKQPNRCSVSKNTCLQNQPKDMWLHDKRAEASGEKGCFFLKNFGVLPEEPIKDCNKSESEIAGKVLTLFFTDTFISVVNLKLKADENVVLRPNSLALIPEVFVDDSNPKRTIIIAKVFNSGLVSSIFKVSISDCPSDLPASFNNIISKPVLIPPQHQHIYSLEIQCELPLKSFYCSLAVINTDSEVLALRKIRFQSSDRCICVWYCRCSCLAEDRRLTCKALPLNHFHAAGFQGGLPIPTHIVHRSLTDDMISLMLYVFLSLFLTLLLLGLIKAILGCCVVTIGLWGLDVILDLPKRLHSYYEKELKGRPVTYNDSGWPIHPDTKNKVRNIPLPTEFSINVIFFFIYPVSVALRSCRRLNKAKEEPLYSELDICKCKQDQISFIRSASLQNSVTKKQQSKNSDTSTNKSSRNSTKDSKKKNSK